MSLYIFRRMREQVLGATLALALSLLHCARPPALHAQGPIAYVVAPSAGTQREAQRMLRFCRWSDTTVVRDADFLLVVVRSSGSDPLEPSYDSLKWLRDAANGQLNDSGAQFHVYLYRIRDDLSFLQASHQSYDVDGSGTLGPFELPRHPLPGNRFGFFCG